ncbi:hypothetical protein DB29_00847 [Shouchella clausii]|nr:hypothetical protein DB29_00847 [Shouchella clausii]
MLLGLWANDYSKKCGASLIWEAEKKGCSQKTSRWEAEKK